MDMAASSALASLVDAGGVGGVTSRDRPAEIMMAKMTRIDKGV